VTELRPAVAADVPRIAEIVQAAYGPYVERIGGKPRPMTDDYEEVVRTRDVFVVEVGDEIAGLVVLDVADERFEVDNVAVAPDHRGTGIGRALLMHAEEEARRRGFDTVHLLTHEKMAENLALYDRIGYVEYGRHPPGEGYLVLLRKRLG
jgi:ribosomal protein S18 acetylase RimI-like enzyme